MTKNSTRYASMMLTLLLCVSVLSATPVQAGNAEGTPMAITLSDNGIEADYPGVYAEGSVLTITLIRLYGESAE